MAIKSEKDKYLKIAIDNITEDALLDGWWMYLYRRRAWYSYQTKQFIKLDSMDGAYLYNVKCLILRIISDGEKITMGASQYIGLLDFLMTKKENTIGGEEGEEKTAGDAPYRYDELPF